MSNAPSIEDSTEKQHLGAQFIYDVATGPISGAGSIVTNPADLSQQKTVARVLDETGLRSNAVWDDDAARAAHTPDYIGQDGHQVDTVQDYNATGLVAGAWALKPVSTATATALADKVSIPLQVLTPAASVSYDLAIKTNAAYTPDADGQELALPTNYFAGASGFLLITAAGGYGVTLAPGWYLDSGDMAHVGNSPAGAAFVLRWNAVDAGSFAATLHGAQAYFDPAPDLSPYGAIIWDTATLAARVTLVGDEVTEIDALGGPLFASSDVPRRAHWNPGVAGVLGGRPSLILQPSTKLTTTLALQDRPVTWFAVFKRYLWNPTTQGVLTAGAGKTITFAEGLPFAVHTGNEFWLLAASLTDVDTQFTLEADFPAGATSLTGTLTEDTSADSVFSTQKGGSRIMRTDGSFKDYLNDTTSGGPSPTQRQFAAKDDASGSATDLTNDDSEGAVILVAQFGSDGDGGVILRVNGVEVAADAVDASTDQIGGSFSLGGPTVGTYGSSTGYLGRAGWMDGKIADIDVAGLETTLADYFGITLP